MYDMHGNAVQQKEPQTREGSWILSYSSHWLDVLPHVRHLTSLDLSFFICKVRNLEQCSVEFPYNSKIYKPTKERKLIFHIKMCYELDHFTYHIDFNYAFSRYFSPAELIYFIWNCFSLLSNKNSLLDIL